MMMKMKEAPAHLMIMMMWWWWWWRWWWWCGGDYEEGGLTCSLCFRFQNSRLSRCQQCCNHEDDWFWTILIISSIITISKTVLFWLFLLLFLADDDINILWRREGGWHGGQEGSWVEGCVASSRGSVCRNTKMSTNPKRFWKIANKTICINTIW